MGTALRAGLRFQASLGKTQRDSRTLLIEVDLADAEGILGCSRTGGDVWSFTSPPGTTTTTSTAVAGGGGASGSSDAPSVAAAGGGGEGGPPSPGSGGTILEKCNTWDKKGRNPAMNVYVHLESSSASGGGSGGGGTDGSSTSSSVESGSGAAGGGGGTRSSQQQQQQARCKLGILVQHALPRLAARLGGYRQLSLDWVSWRCSPFTGAPILDSLASVGKPQDEAHWQLLRELAKQRETGAGTSTGSSPPTDSAEEEALRRAKESLVEAARFFGPAAVAKVSRLTVRKLYSREYHFYDGEKDIGDSRKHALEWAVGLAAVDRMLSRNPEAKAKLSERLTGPGASSGGANRKRLRPMSATPTPGAKHAGPAGSTAQPTAAATAAAAVAMAAANSAARAAAAAAADSAFVSVAPPLLPHANAAPQQQQLQLQQQQAQQRQQSMTLGPLFGVPQPQPQQHKPTASVAHAPHAFADQAGSVAPGGPQIPGLLSQLPLQDIPGSLTPGMLQQLCAEVFGGSSIAAGQDATQAAPHGPHSSQQPTPSHQLQRVGLAAAPQLPPAPLPPGQMVPNLPHPAHPLQQTSNAAAASTAAAGMLPGVLDPIDLALDAWERHDIAQQQLAAAHRQIEQQRRELASLAHQRDQLQQQLVHTQAQLQDVLQQQAQQGQPQGQGHGHGQGSLSGQGHAMGAQASTSPSPGQAQSRGPAAAPPPAPASAAAGTSELAGFTELQELLP